MPRYLTMMTREREARLRDLADTVVSSLDDFKRLSGPVHGFRHKNRLLALRDRAAEVLESALQE